MISAAEARGHARMVEMNRQVADNLTKVIASLEQDGPIEDPRGLHRCVLTTPLA
jgi:hypothetical protein